MLSNFRHLPDLLGIFLAITAQWIVFRAFRPSLVRTLLLAAGSLWIVAGFVFSAPTFAQMLPYSPIWEWFRGIAIVYAILIVLYATVRQGMVTAKVITPKFQPTRREAMAAVVPAALGGYGVFIEPNRLRTTETRIAIAGLAPALDGLRIAQLTDIHYGPYFGQRELQRAVDMANETRPHLGMVTGDFISIRRDPLDDCLRLLAKFKADAGIYGCLGNHEVAADCEDYATEAAARLGMRILRGESEALRFGDAQLNLAGVDYQKSRARYLANAAHLVQPGITNMLLCHNPDVFPTAVSQGWDLTLAGHTHGGQVDVEILGEHLNPARFFTPYIYGVYQQAGKSILVSRGLGTVGAPIRVGAPPEVNLITLVAAPAIRVHTEGSSA